MEGLVIDANFAVSLLIKYPWSDAAEEMLVNWKKQKKSLFAPAVWYAEVASSVRKAVFAGVMSEADALKAVASLPLLGVQVVLSDAELLQDSLRWAARLEQMVAYDAQYVALAAHLNVPFWTVDKRLFHRCKDLGVAFVNLLE